MNEIDLSKNTKTKDDIKIEQVILNNFIVNMNADGYKMPSYLKIDGHEGPKTVRVLNMFLALESNTLVVSKGHMPQAIPAVTGRKDGEANFGGCNDKWDRTWGQANLTRNCKNPGEILVKYKNLLHLFDIDLILKYREKFPYTTDEKGNRKLAGLSYFLDTNAHYCALYVRLGEMGFVNEKCLRVKLTNLRTGKSIINLVTDYGPHPKTNNQLDLSPGDYKYLEIQGMDQIKIEISNSLLLGQVENNK